MFNLNLSYAMLVDAGFKRYDYEDAVFYQEHGHHPFVMHMRLSKTVKMEIHCEFDYALLYQAKKRPYKNNFQSYMQLNTLEEVRMTLAVFGHPEKAMCLKYKDGMNYCDENGCVDRKRNLVDPCGPIDQTGKEASHV